MRVIIGLGGNVGDVWSAFDRAVAALGESAGLEICGRSSLYRTVVVGPEQPPYLNAAIMVAVEISARDLLGLCHRIEAKSGRDRKNEGRWGPRTLDLDLLIADALICRGPVLNLPHPRFAERAFALIPAAELAPEWIHPLEGRTLADLAKRSPVKERGAVECVGDW